MYVSGSRNIALLKIYPMLLHESLGIRFRYHLDGTITEADIEELAIVVVRSFNNDYTRMITLFEGLYRQIFISSQRHMCVTSWASEVLRFQELFFDQRI